MHIDRSTDTFANGGTQPNACQIQSCIIGPLLHYDVHMEVQGVIEKSLGVGRLFAVLLVLLNCLTESTFPSPSLYSNPHNYNHFSKFWWGGGGGGGRRYMPPKITSAHVVPGGHMPVIANRNLVRQLPPAPPLPR